MLQNAGTLSGFEYTRYTVVNRMRRTMIHFMLGIFFSALATAALSVYVFHDVDRELIGRWNEAFVGSFGEIILFTLVIGGGVTLLTFLGRYFFHLKEYSPRAKLGLVLGIGVTVFQYPWDFASRKIIPNLADSSLGIYLIVAIVLCSVVLVRDSFRQMKLRQAQASSSDS